MRLKQLDLTQLSLVNFRKKKFYKDSFPKNTSDEYKKSSNIS